jgi:glycine oxidase
MLAAGIEAEPTEEALFALARWSQALWPGFAAELEAAAGLPVGYDATGTLVCAFTRDQAEKLRFTASRSSAALGRVRMADRAAAPASASPAWRPTWSPPRSARTTTRSTIACWRRPWPRRSAAPAARLVTGIEAAVDLAGGRAVGIVAGDSRHPADVMS